MCKNVQNSFSKFQLIHLLDDIYKTMNTKKKDEKVLKQPIIWMGN